MMGRLERSLYGTRDAALNWSLKYTTVMESIGFTKGASPPCTFYNATRRVCMTVHGDDFISEGDIDDLRWVEKKLLEHFQLKTEIRGADPGLQKEARVLNRVISWGD